MTHIPVEPLTAATATATSRRVSDSSHLPQNLNDNNKQSWVLPNNAVAQSDREAVLQAVEDTIREAIEDINPSDQTAAQQRKLFQDIQLSLMANIDRIIDPVADADFGDYLDLYHVVPTVEDSDTSTSNIIDTEGGDIDDAAKETFDPDDLLDSKALVEAQELRSTVRELAKSVQNRREQVLKDSLRTTFIGQCDVLMEESYNKQNDDENASSTPDDNIDQRMVTEQSAMLESSMHALSTLLHDSQWAKLPEQLDALQNTIDVIQKESDKNRPMSQIEAAIISRSNSIGEDENDDSLNAESWQENLTPAERLAHFFEQIE